MGRKKNSVTKHRYINGKWRTFNEPILTPEQERKKRKEYQKLNKEKILKWRKRYYQDNKEKIQEYNKEWRKNRTEEQKEKDREYQRNYQRSYHLKKLGITQQEWNERVKQRQLNSFFKTNKPKSRFNWGKVLERILSPEERLEIRREKSRNSYWNNKEPRQKCSRRYYLKNQERLKQVSRDWYANNKKKHYETCRKYRESNKKEGCI